MLKYGEELLGTEGPGKWEFPKLDLKGPLTNGTDIKDGFDVSAPSGSAMAV
ncbi:hypothetical protein ACQY0O_008208 [Thecaphora frezii]